MSREVYRKRAEEKPTCGYCGRTLDSGFNYICHVCGAAYCYSHKPDRCDHKPVRPATIDSLSDRN